ncbi:MAG: hypothetical protein GXC75_17890 [Xanthomonadaceae bacterium]|nr:hypothetical protein [Xanthomonadaceae bacterium]
MTDNKEHVTVVVECYRDGEKARVSVAELGLSLTIANRIVNRFATPADQYSRYDSSRYEPDSVQLEIVEVRDGSVILQAAMDIAQSPFAQGVASGMLANKLSPTFDSAVRSISSSFRRLGHAAVGKTVFLTVQWGRNVIRIVTEYRGYGKSSTHVLVQVPDDVQ